MSELSNEVPAEDEGELDVPAPLFGEDGEPLFDLPPLISVFIWSDWYWAASDGRVYSSARQLVTGADDEGYLAWLDINGAASPWPSTPEGEQTDAELQKALSPFGLLVGIPAHIADRRWRREVRGITVEIAGEPVLVSTQRGDDRAALHQVYSAIRDGLRQDGATFNFADGKPRSVSNADMMAAILAALAHVQAAFDLGADVLAQYEAGQIMTVADIDAAFA
ncbi:DUF4376 domain-containing protein [Bosea sp. BK604]|uniref:DUF4376 domain-containing protein n=1 Tax=Bosea sp. BK604 TaxID=2512180 RepID=UPI00104E668E|nr:DUF4376 domain-containing protein [Bosea sp. BK604]TCR70529.1 uncharacterized protein DUF4376 [Bosea sp. BK604]